MEIKQYIEMYRMRELVKNIVALLFDEDGEYCPELYDYAFWVTVSDVYADTGSDMEIDDFMRKLYMEGWMEELRNKINPLQLEAIEDAVCERVQARLNKNPLEPMADALTVLLNGLSELLNGLSKDFNAAETKGLLEAVKDMKEINADSLVEAYIKNQK